MGMHAWDGPHERACLQISLQYLWMDRSCYTRPTAAECTALPAFVRISSARPGMIASIVGYAAHDDL